MFTLQFICSLLKSWFLDKICSSSNTLPKPLQMVDVPFQVILKKRKMFEYKLRRRTKIKEDYLLYAQYEMNLLTLIRKRRKDIGYFFKKEEIDYAVVHRVHKLFHMACMRFSSDVKLWLSHVEFCKLCQQVQMIGKIYTSMLQVHTTKPDLWILASKWEMEDNGSMDNARGLLQRSLRFNPDSQLLWREYFRMELLNADKLHKRMEVLDLALCDLEDDEMSQVVLSGQVALVVYKKAAEKFSDDVAFLLSMADICAPFSFTDSVQEVILNDLSNLHGNSELLADWKAREFISQADKVWTDKTNKKKVRVVEVEGLERRCWDRYDLAVSTIPTEQMWTLYLKTCLGRLNSSTAKKLHPLRLQHTLSVMEDAFTHKGLVEDMALQWVDLVDGSALDDLTERLTDRFPSSVGLWEQRLGAVAEKGVETVTNVWETALKSVSEKESLPLWSFMCDWSSINQPETLPKIYERGVWCCREVSVPLKEAYLEWTSCHSPLKHTRSLYNKLAANQPLSVGFFRKYITIEREQLCPSVEHIRRGFEKALEIFGETESDLWLDYIRLEAGSLGEGGVRAGQIYHRAKKCLTEDAVERFITQHTLLQTSNHL